jgi:hypothetical protein
MSGSHTAAMKITVPWNVTPCTLVPIYFFGVYYLNFQSGNRFSETPVNKYQTIRY